MLRYTFFYLVIFASSLFAQTNNTETAYERPLPFDPFVDSYQYTVQKQYESLPIVTDTSNIPGTLELAEAELSNRLSQGIAWKNTTPQGIYWQGTNLQPVGRHLIEVRNLKSDYYFWCIYGKIQFFVKRNEYGPTPIIGKPIENYFMVLHFNKGDAKAHLNYYTVGPNIIYNNTQTLSAISHEAMTSIADTNKKAYEEVKVKTRWTIDDKPQSGTFDTYRNGKVTLTMASRRTTYDVKRFSLEDQILIRGYIDQQGIPAREVNMQRR